MQIPPLDRTQTPWRTQGADLYSTGASGPVPVRPVHAANPVESTDRLGEGATLREPTEPSVPDEANRDWTVSEATGQYQADELSSCTYLHIKHNCSFNISCAN